MCAAWLLVDTFLLWFFWPSPPVPVICCEYNPMAIVLRYALVIRIVGIVFYYLLSVFVAYVILFLVRACLVSLVVSD